MATTIYPDYDGVVFKYVSDTWANVRNASSGNLTAVSFTTIYNSHTSGRGGNVYNVGRYFLEFDTSAINKTISSATLQIYGSSLNSLDVILFKSSQSGAVGTGDFNEVDGASSAFAASDGSGAGSFTNVSYSGDVTYYSNEVTTWSISGYNTFTLTDTAKADIIANDTFNCVMMGFDYDVRDVAPSSISPAVGFFTDAKGGTTQDPKLVITEQENSVFFGANF